MKNKKVLINIIILLVIIASLLTVILIYVNKKYNVPSEHDNIATVSIDGKDILTINLTQQNNTTIDLKEKYGVPAQLEVKDHQIRFINVTCPDKICEGTGFLKENLDVAICMPNKVTVIVSSIEKKD